MAAAGAATARAPCAAARSGEDWSWRLQSQVETARHALENGDGLAEGAPAGGGEDVIALPATAALRRRLPDPREHEALVLESRERFINSGEAHVSPRLLD